ncbi:DMT family transporter, partial [Streptomyces scabiei]|uniref:DMT family transporter n=1 Tax=Streptomyces scabiei TaxID=1930 RepID=UPI00298F5621
GGNEARGLGSVYKRQGGGVLGGDAWMDGRAVPAWVLLGWVVLLATVVAYGTGVVAVRRLSPQVAGVVGCLEAVVATVLAWVLLGEHLSAPQIAGGAVVLVGAFVAQRSAVGETVPPLPAGAVEEEAEPELSVRP